MGEIASLLVVALAGGMLPLFVRWSERLLHGALSLSTGIFLGAVFLHLLPALPAMVPSAGDVSSSSHGHAPSETLAIWLCVLAGVLSVYLAESLVFQKRDPAPDQRHRSVGYAALAGLSAHSFLTGIGLAASSRHEGLEAPIFLAIVSHHGFEAFSLTSVFLLAGFAKRRIVVLAGLFALATPAGIVLGHLVTGSLGDFALAVVTAFSAGTFLFVCLCDLLPEVFHDREDEVQRIALVVLGILVMVAVRWAGA